TCPSLAIFNTCANRRADLRRLVPRFGNNVNVFNTQGGHFISTGSGDPIGIYLASGVGPPIDATCSHKSASATSQHGTSFDTSLTFLFAGALAHFSTLKTQSQYFSKQFRLRTRADIMLDANHSSAELWSTDTEICGLYLVSLSSFFFAQRSAGSWAVCLALANMLCVGIVFPVIHRIFTLR
ncbi:hypothetical protein EDB86DRAFT_2902282, partial [Lactarius hatsudake]